MDTGFMGSIYKFSDWVTKFIYLNVLWILFSFVGLFLFGFFPATVAMFSVVRKWVLSETDIPVFKTFWTTYKTDFIKSNFLGYITSIIGYILYLDLAIVRDASNIFIQTLFVLFIVIGVIYLLTTLYIFPIFVHYETKLLHVFKNAFLIVISHPITSIFMGIAGLIFYIIVYLFPIILPIFGGSGLAFILMWYSNFTFVKIQNKLDVSK